MSHEPAIFDRLALLADATRTRLLLVLEEQELTVSELCSVLQLPQSTVSRHLKVLGDAGWVGSRRDGTRRHYRATLERLDPAAAGLWRLIREQAASLPAAGEDARRLSCVLAERRSRSEEFFSSAAGRWDQLRSTLFGEQVELMPLLGLLDSDWTVGDLGCGTGRTAEVLAPFVRRVVAVDDSGAMIEAARARLDPHANVEVRRGRLENLPLPDACLDAAVLALVLHHVPEPGRALAEVARVLRPDGRLLLVDMMPHEREEYRQDMGHVWLGLAEERLTGWVAAAGFEALRVTPLPPDPKAQGPGLFAAAARRARVAARKPRPEASEAVPAT